jgi:hypothetical protein
LSPRGEFCPLGVTLSPGVKFSVRPSILLNSRGVNIPLGDKYQPWGPGVKLRMALRNIDLWPKNLSRADLNATFRNATFDLNQEPILRPLHLQLQRCRCSKPERFSKYVEENVLFNYNSTQSVVNFKTPMALKP